MNDKPLSEWTLKEVQEMCIGITCKECLFYKFNPRVDIPLCSIDFKPEDWELEENE